MMTPAELSDKPFEIFFELHGAVTVTSRFIWRNNFGQPQRLGASSKHHEALQSCTVILIDGLPGKWGNPGDSTTDKVWVYLKRCLVHAAFLLGGN